MNSTDFHIFHGYSREIHLWRSKYVMLCFCFVWSSLFYFLFLFSRQKWLLFLNRLDETDFVVCEISFILVSTSRYFTMLAEFNREVNKAFCGFFNQSKYNQYESLFLESGEDVTNHTDKSRNSLPVNFLSSLFSAFDIILER